MAKDMLMWDETLFKNGAVLEFDHLPERFEHRDNQMNSLGYCLRPVLAGMRAVNCLLSGPPGTGKTTAVLKMFERMKERTNKVLFVKVNCQMDSTRFAVISRIYRALFNLSPPSSGVAYRKLFEKVVNHLIETDRSLIVCLDDINYLFHEGHADEIMYSMLRAHEQYPGARIGVMVVVSDVGKLYRFDPGVNSVFLPEEIDFPLYTYDELKSIIDERIHEAFYPDVVSPEVRDAVVDHIDSTGDLRVGIDLLKRAGLNAEKRASRSISVEDVEKAYETSRLLHLRRSIRSLTKGEVSLLLMVAENESSQAGDIYRIFHESTGLGYTRFYEMVNKLTQDRYLDANFTGKGMRGRTRMIRSRYNAVDIRKCMQ